MNRIDEAFAKHSFERPLFIPFVTTGDPSPEVTPDIVKTLVNAGADIVELGVPYSDPIADGPTIQKASARALKHRLTIQDCIGMVQTLRKEGVDIPIVLFSYYNPVLQYGLDRFFPELKASGGDGVIIPDLPIEEAAEIKAGAARHDLRFISMVAPTSSDRIARIAKEAEGFLYCVSSLGVTGVRDTLHPEIESFLASVREHASVPLAVGFGISNREQVRQLSSLADGVIVGSAIVRKIEENEALLTDPQKRREGLANIADFVRSLTGRKS